MIPELKVGERLRKVGAVVLGLSVGVLFSGSLMAQSDANFEKQWSELVEAAKKEGELSLSIGAMPEFQSVLDAFTKKFGVTVKTSTGSGSARATRILAERKAGRYEVDVGMLSVAATTRRMEPSDALEDMPSILFHPDVTDTSKWYGNQHWYVDKGNTKTIFVMNARATNEWVFWYNTNKVSPEDVAALKMPNDFLDPKWKGMMADQSWGDPGRVGDLLEVYFAPDAGPDWVRKYLTEMNVSFTSDPRLEETWLVRGRNPLKWHEGNIGDQLRDLVDKGLPIKQGKLDKEEGTIEARGSECCIVMLKNAPHPNAAKLFTNWLLTSEGQKLVHQIDPPRPYMSLRTDVPALNTSPVFRRVEGKKYRFRDFDEEYLSKVGEARKFIVETFNERPKN